MNGNPPDYERRALTLAAVTGIVLVLRGGPWSGILYGAPDWHIALYLVSVSAFGIAAALCGLVLVPETWPRIRRPKSQLFLWAALAFVAGLLVTAGAFVATAVDAIRRDSPFG